MKKQVILLAIETSCDETAAAILSVQLQKNKPPLTTTLSTVVKSQIQLHAKMGGVVPETAARAHVQNILPVIQKTLADANMQLTNIDYLAVTQGPGLIPSLIVGVEFAKALSLATGIPVLPINHMAGHLYSPLSGDILKLPKQQIFPVIGLIVSGGHSMLVLMKNLYDYKILGQTVDDAAGEAFDKVAKLLNLPYPGGPEVSKQAEQGLATIHFPRPMIHSKDYNFSFAGLKTAVLYYLRDHQKIGAGAKAQTADICTSFQQAVIDVLLAKTFRAVKQYKAKTVTLSGGVSANKALRAALQAKCQELHLRCLLSPLTMAGDNAEMIGLAAAIALNHTVKLSPISNIHADPNLEL